MLACVVEGGTLGNSSVLVLVGLYSFCPASHVSQRCMATQEVLTPVSSTFSLSAVTCGAADSTTFTTDDVLAKTAAEAIPVGFALVISPVITTHT